jgi:hypothetical protein
LRRRPKPTLGCGAKERRKKDKNKNKGQREQQTDRQTANCTMRSFIYFNLQKPLYAHPVKQNEMGRT